MAPQTLDVGAPVITDYGAHWIADTFTDDETGAVMVGIVVDGALVWVDADTVQALAQ